MSELDKVFKQNVRLLARVTELEAERDKYKNLVMQALAVAPEDISARVLQLQAENDALRTVLTPSQRKRFDAR